MLVAQVADDPERTLRVPLARILDGHEGRARHPSVPRPEHRGDRRLSRGPSLHPIGAMSGMRPRGLLGRRACLNRSPRPRPSSSSMQTRRAVWLTASRRRRGCRSSGGRPGSSSASSCSSPALGWLLGATATIVGPVDRRGDHRDRDGADRRALQRHRVPRAAGAALVLLALLVIAIVIALVVIGGITAQSAEISQHAERSRSRTSSRGRECRRRPVRDVAARRRASRRRARAHLGADHRDRRRDQRPDVARVRALVRVAEHVLPAQGRPVDAQPGSMGTSACRDPPAGRSPPASSSRCEAISEA